MTLELQKRWRAPGSSAIFLFLCAGVRAQAPLLDEVHTVAAADRAVPIEHSFDISTAGAYQVTLVDLGATLQAPAQAAPLASVKLAVTSAAKVVGTPLAAPGSTQFTATPGTYVIHVIGMPGTVAGSGPIGIQVTSAADNSQIAAFSDTLALPASAVPANEAVLDDSFTVAAAGNYQVTLSDLQLPQSLSILTLTILDPSGALVPNATLATAGTSGPLALQSGVTYRILAAGQAATSPNAGLFGVNVSTTGGGPPAYARAVPVGAVTLLGSPTLTADAYTLSLVDLAFPNPLQTTAAEVVLNGQAIAQLAAPGSQGFTASASTYQVFTLGLPASAGPGSYSVVLQGPGGPPALSLARAAAAPGGPIYGYSFDTSAAASGTYGFDLADFAFQTPLTSISAVAVQGGVVLGSPLTAAGSLSIAPAAGPISLLAFAKPNTSGGASGGLFGVDLTPSGASAPTFETTQGVGQLFAVRKVTVSTPGNYGLGVADVGFPTSFPALSVIVTRGTTPIVTIFGSTGNSPFSFAATSGDYFVNFIAQPGGVDKAGTYALTVAPQPTVTLTGSVSHVATGSSASLTWSSQGASTCTASGGWSGQQALSGTASTIALTANTSFTLSCSGVGGVGTQSVTIAVDPASSTTSGKGGGGSLDVSWLAMLAGLLLMDCRRRFDAS